MSDDAAPTPRKRHALSLFAGLPGRYDRAGALMSMGQDPRWRATMVEALDPRPGQRILDVACGTGLVTEALVRRGAGTVVALDQSEAMLEGLRHRMAGDQQLAGRVEPLLGQAESLPFPDASFDALTFTYLLRYVDDPAATLRELARVVRPGGAIGMVEFGVPPRRRLRWAWQLYTRRGLPALGRLISPAWEEVGRFLGPSIEDLARRLGPERLAAAWREAGIADVRVRRMSFGAGLVLTGARR